jgi:23S rRNA (guanine2445-N2)-methyltransferase / 23S rRNA (guanine2069-N7)-methyltransferase
MLANRLRKNLARLEPWARREGLEAWRVYDRDIPEIPWSIDRYGDNALLTEHVTPVSLRQSEEAHADEVARVLDAAGSVLGLPPDRLFTRTRARHRSIEREAAGNPAHEFPVRERELRFLVNLTDYLDTGLFLDHREARRRVGTAAHGKRVLNLFCYTGAFTAYAAKGGASWTVSVDLSATYLAWAERNLRLNALTGDAHALVRADVFEWLRGSREEFDLIVLDPPTVSRSSRGKSFDIQSTHVELLRLALARLAPGGVLLFSTNHRTFRLEEGRLPEADVREITTETQSRDFREQLHRSWELRVHT